MVKIEFTIPAWAYAFLLPLPFAIVISYFIEDWTVFWGGLLGCIIGLILGVILYNREKERGF